MVTTSRNGILKAIIHLNTVIVIVEKTEMFQDSSNGSVGQGDR